MQPGLNQVNHIQIKPLYGVQECLGESSWAFMDVGTNSNLVGSCQLNGVVKLGKGLLDGYRRQQVQQGLPTKIQDQNLKDSQCPTFGAAYINDQLRLSAQIQNQGSHLIINRLMAKATRPDPAKSKTIAATRSNKTDNPLQKDCGSDCQVRFKISSKKSFKANLSSYIAHLRRHHQGISSKEYIRQVHRFIAAFKLSRKDSIQAQLVSARHQIRVCKACSGWGSTRPIVQCIQCEDYYHVGCSANGDPRDDDWLCATCEEVANRSFHDQEYLNRFLPSVQCRKCTKQLHKKHSQCMKCGDKYHLECFGTSVVCSDCHLTIQSKLKQGSLLTLGITSIPKINSPSSLLASSNMNLKLSSHYLANCSKLNNNANISCFKTDKLYRLSQTTAQKSTSKSDSNDEWSQSQQELTLPTKTHSASNINDFLLMGSTMNIDRHNLPSDSMDTTENCFKINIPSNMNNHLNGNNINRINHKSNTINNININNNRLLKCEIPLNQCSLPLITIPIMTNIPFNCPLPPLVDDQTNRISKRSGKEENSHKTNIQKGYFNQDKCDQSTQCTKPKINSHNCDTTNTINSNVNPNNITNNTNINHLNSNSNSNTNLTIKSKNSSKRPLFKITFPKLTQPQLQLYRQSLLYAIEAKKMRYAQQLVPINCTLDDNTEQSLDFGLQRLTSSELEIYLEYKKQPIGPFLLKYDPDMGYDVVCDMDLPKGCLICEYIGDVVTLRTVVNSSKSIQNDSLMELKAGPNADQTLLVRPQNFTNIARFINGANNKKINSLNGGMSNNNSNSNNTNTPNIQTRRVIALSQPCVLLYSSRSIKKGQRLIYDYNAGGLNYYDTSHFV